MSIKKGISLIVLVITIIVMIVLAATVVISLSNSGIFNTANKATLQTSLKAIQTKLELFEAQKIKEHPEFKVKEFYADSTSVGYNTKGKYTVSKQEKTIKDIFNDGDIDDKIISKLKISAGRLIYAAESDKERAWVEEIDIYTNEWGIRAGRLDSSDTALGFIKNGKLELPSAVTTIGAGAYAYTNLTEVVIPDSVTIIENDAFRNCSSLTSVTLGDNVTTIGERAFYGCTAITSIEIPSKVTSIGTSAFSACSKLSTFDMTDSGITTIPSSMLYSCPALTAITIRSGITKINDSAFSSCSGLVSVTIPSTVTTISSSVFSGCTALSSIVLEGATTTTTTDNNITTTTNSTSYFDAVENNATIALYRKSTNSLMMVLDKNRNSLNTADRLTSFEVKNGTASIDSYVFSNAMYIQHLDIPETVTDFGSQKVLNLMTQNLTSVTIIDSNGDGDTENYSTGLNGELIYRTDNGVKGLVLCLSNASSISIPVADNVQRIYTYSFYYRRQLETLILPEGVTTIDSYPFDSCLKLYTITVPSTVTSLSNMFTYGSGVYNINLNENNATYKYENGMLLSKDGKMLYYVIDRRSDSVTVPNTIETIATYAFHNYASLKNVTIPSSVKKIQTSFQYCSGLTAITIPSSVTEIGINAFYSCTSLTRIVIDKTRIALSSDNAWGAPRGNRIVYWNP